jgi:hypothetical protein
MCTGVAINKDQLESHTMKSKPEKDPLRQYSIFFIGGIIYMYMYIIYKS